MNGIRGSFEFPEEKGCICSPYACEKEAEGLMFPLSVRVACHIDIRIEKTFGEGMRIHGVDELGMQQQGQQYDRQDGGEQWLEEEVSSRTAVHCLRSFFACNQIRRVGVNAVDKIHGEGEQTFA